jgi:hypothetical protein
MYFALLGAFGEDGTSDWVFDNFSGDSLTPEAIAAVARTEMRLGTLAQGRLRREALARLGAAPDDPQTRAIVEAFARTGDQSGLAALAELHRRMVAQAAPGDVVNYGLATLVLAPPAEVLPLFRAYLERLRVAGEIYAGRRGRLGEPGLDPDLARCRAGDGDAGDPWRAGRPGAL